MHPPGNPFAERLAADGQALCRGERVPTLQLNLGKLCNLACHHCHVDAGPARTEVMPWEVMERLLDWIDRRGMAVGLGTVDLTGGAPELNPSFRRLVRELRRRDLHVLDRCNLAVLHEPGQEDLADFLAARRVEIVASLPCYLEENVDAQRGRGAFRKSVDALRALNAAGYGSGELRLDLVYNPTGFGLPGDQAELEAAYKRELRERYGIVFDRLWTITNMPILRFEEQLRRAGELDAYLGKLQAAHRPENVDGVMCRTLLSVDWEGAVYDCDFNQMLEIPFAAGRKLWDVEPAELAGRPIPSGMHCFGCTAGAGSSCTGALSA